MRRANAQTSFHGLPPKVPGMNWTAMASTMPRVSPPTTAPQTLPMPPSTAAVNALRPARKPIRKLMFVTCSPWATPATAARWRHREGDDDDAVDVDAHEARGVGVLRDGLHPAAVLVRLTKYRDRRRT